MVCARGQMAATGCRLDQRGDTMDDKQRGMALMAAGYGFGTAGLLAPRAVAAAFGTAEPTEDHLGVLRMLAIRNLALAAVFQSVADDDKLRKRFFAIAAAMFSADTAAGLLGAATGRLSWRTVGSLGAVTGALAAIAASGAAAA